MDTKRLRIHETIRRLGMIALAVAALTVASKNALATAIPIEGDGVANFSNVVGDLVSVSSNTACIAFSGSAPACPGGPTSVLVSGSDAVFGTTGTIKDIGVSFPITGFETANLTVAGGPAMWDLLSIAMPSGYAACTTTTTSGACSSGTFILTQTTPTQVSISLAANEIGYIGSSSTGSTPYNAIFTTQLSGNLTAFGCTTNCTDTIGNILAWESGSGHVIKSTWSESASPISAVPEPATSGLIGLALLGLGLWTRRQDVRS